MTYKKSGTFNPGQQPGSIKNRLLFLARMLFISAEKLLDCGPRQKIFSSEEMAEGVAFAHAHGVKVYVTAKYSGAQL